MPRSLTVLAAFALVIGPGVVHGTWTHRWQKSAALEAAVARMARLPEKAGAWTADDPGEELPREELALAGAEGAWMRQFTSAKSRQSVRVILLCGRTGPMCVHRPEDCYPSQGYELLAAPARHTLKSPSATPPVFWTARFVRSEAGGGASLRIFWGWFAHDGWKAPEHPRWTFAREPYLYKLYVIRGLPYRGDRPEDDPAADFLNQFIPELTRALSPQ